MGGGNGGGVEAQSRTDRSGSQLRFIRPWNDLGETTQSSFSVPFSPGLDFYFCLRRAETEVGPSFLDKNHKLK